MTNSERLQDLFRKSSFYEYKEPPEWEGLTIEQDPQEGEHISLPDPSYFGHTSIAFTHDYEGYGADCLFIQELVRLYMQGKIKVS